MGQLGSRKDFLQKYEDPVLLKIEEATAGITALFLLRDLIEEEDCDLDVGLGFLVGVEASWVGLFVL